MVSPAEPESGARGRIFGTVLLLDYSISLGVCGLGRYSLAPCPDSRGRGHFVLVTPRILALVLLVFSKIADVPVVVEIGRQASIASGH